MPYGAVACQLQRVEHTFARSSLVLIWHASFLFPLVLFCHVHTKYGFYVGELRLCRDCAHRESWCVRGKDAMRTELCAVDTVHDVFSMGFSVVRALS